MASCSDIRRSPGRVWVSDHPGSKLVLLSQQCCRRRSACAGDDPSCRTDRLVPQESHSKRGNELLSWIPPQIFLSQSEMVWLFWIQERKTRDLVSFTTTDGEVRPAVAPGYLEEGLLHSEAGQQN